jgi:hypothetical protein
MSAASALQKAIFARLSGDAALTAIVGATGVTDRRLSEPTVPLVVIAGIDSVDHSTASEPGEEHTVTLEAWSEAAGHRQVQAIAAAVRFPATTSCCSFIATPSSGATGNPGSTGRTCGFGR